MKKSLKLVSDYAVAVITVTVFRLIKLLGVDRASALGGWLGRTVGPYIPVSRIARSNLEKVFPEKSHEERERILRGSWENLGRVAAEYPFLHEIWDFDRNNPQAGRIKAEPHQIDLFGKLKDDGQPALLFSGHLANWELLAVCAEHHGLPLTVMFRAPNNRFLVEKLEKLRKGVMGELIGASPAAAFGLVAALDRGGHVGLLVDQRLGRGPLLDFMGVPARTNPLFARLAREYACPIHAARVIRLEGCSFRLEMTEEIYLPKDAEGKVDVKASMQKVNEIIEGWVREHPEQWLWLHRRWRP